MVYLCTWLVNNVTCYGCLLGLKSSNTKLILYKYIIMPVHSDRLLVAKKFDILKPSVAKTCNISSVGINICVQLSVAIDL